MRRVDSTGLGGSTGAGRPSRSGSLGGTVKDGLRPQSSRMRRDSLEREFAAMLANLSQDSGGGPPKPLPRPPASIAALSETLSNTLRSTTGGPAIRDAIAATSTMTRQSHTGSSNAQRASPATASPSSRAAPNALRGASWSSASASASASSSRPVSGRLPSNIVTSSGSAGSSSRPMSVNMSAAMGSSGRSRGGSSPGSSRGSSPTNRTSAAANSAAPALSTSTGSFLQQQQQQPRPQRPASTSFGSRPSSPPLPSAAGMKRAGPGSAPGGSSPGRPAPGIQQSMAPSPAVYAGSSDSLGFAASAGSPSATPRSVMSTVSSLGMATPVSSAVAAAMARNQPLLQQQPPAQPLAQVPPQMLAPPSMLTAYLPGDEDEGPVDEDDDTRSVSTTGGSSVATGTGTGAGATTSSQRTGGASERIQVCVRVKPLDVAREEECAWMWQDNVITQTIFPPWEAKSLYRQASGRAQISYGFDHLFTPTHSTQDIYDESLRGLVRSSLDGVHATVFAYGQTATGKTHTLQGTAASPGVIPLAIYDCFASLPKDRAFRFKVSYLEIYNEQLRDLLCPSTPAARIQMMEDKRTGATVKGLKEEDIYSPAEALALIAQGEEQRHVGATDLNAESSRSHTIFRLLIESRPVEGVGPLRSSILSLIDLAGSENAKLTNATGGRQREGNYINKSLLALGTVIQKLSEASSRASIRGGDVATHVPFRDSKLTRFLQPALEGNALIAIICSISVSVVCLDETHNTLKFASRAKRIRVRAEVNETLDEGALITKYKEEIAVLREQLSRAATMTNSPRRGINPPSSLVACLNHLDGIIGRAGVAGRNGQEQEEGGGGAGANSGDPLVQELQRLKENLVAYSATAASAALRTGGNLPPSLPPASGPASPADADASAQEPASAASPLLAAAGKTLSLEEDSPLHSQIRDLRSRLEQKEVTEYLIHADRNFLQQLVMEREAMLAEITAVVEEVDERQRALETYITELAEENARLRAQQRPSSLANFRRLNSTPEPSLMGRGSPSRQGGLAILGSSSAAPPLLRAAAAASSSGSLSLPAPASTSTSLLPSQPLHQQQDQGDAPARPPALFVPVLGRPSTVNEEEAGGEQAVEQEEEDEFTHELLGYRKDLLTQHRHQQVVFGGKPASMPVSTIEESHVERVAAAADELQP